MSDDFAQGGCSCGQVRYSLTTEPLFVHCCHCRHCQRETGSAFALNALIESRCVKLSGASPQWVAVPSASGKGQDIARCGQCQVALWSHYAGAGKAISFVRAGTLDDTGLCPPDIHIYTESKQSWVKLDDTIPVVPRYYRKRDYWPPAAIARWQAR